MPQDPSDQGNRYDSSQASKEKHSTAPLLNSSDWRSPCINPTPSHQRKPNWPHSAGCSSHPRMHLRCALVLALLLVAPPAALGCGEAAGTTGGDRMIGPLGDESEALIGVDLPFAQREAQEKAALEAEAAAHEAMMGGIGGAAQRLSVDAANLRTVVGKDPDAPWYSRTWGENGELWKAQKSQIMDTSYAGYREGKVWPPTPFATNVYNIKDYGAKGDGKHDDTKAFVNALGSLMDGTLYLPRGTYLITQPITIKSNLVIRGAGQGMTTILLPKSFTDLYGNNNIAGPDRSRYSGGPFFITFSGNDNPGRDPTAKLADITANAAKGARVLSVNSTQHIKVGQLVRLVMTDPGQGQMIKPMLAPVVCADNCNPNSCGPFGQDGNISRMLGRYDLKFYRHFSYVTAKTAHSITLERPIPDPISKSWFPIVERYSPGMQRAGVQDLTIKFKPRQYLGHFHEYGYNAISMYGARDSWVRNVEIRNADIGVAWVGMSFSTMQNVRLTADKIRYQPCCNNTGHHGIWIILSSDNVISDFKVDAQYVHDVALENSSINNVISRGGGYNLNVDFHRYMPWGNLITEVDCGFCYRLYVSSGAGGKGPHAGPYNTFWNIKCKNPTYFGIFGGQPTMYRMLPPGQHWGPKFNFVGVFGQNVSWSPLSLRPDPSILVVPGFDAKGKKKSYRPGWYIENKAEGGLRPTNLWKAMIQTRKKRLAAQPKLR